MGAIFTTSRTKFKQFEIKYYFFRVGFAPYVDTTSILAELYSILPATDTLVVVA